jgi:hypothetical protein
MLPEAGITLERSTSTATYKVHIAIDSLSLLPIMLTVTKAGYGENRTVRWFVKMFLKISFSVEKFLGDGAYDAYGTRRLLIKKLKAIPFIALNPRNCKGNTPEKKMERGARSSDTNRIARIS